MTRKADPEPWYRAGLCFQCTRCGNCCTGEPGHVWLTDDEVAVLARRLDYDEPSFRRRFTRRVIGIGVTLIEKSNNDCVFYDRREGCTVYSDRPRQCRTWPFWRPIVETETTWEVAARDCPGMNQGPRHDLVAIRSRLDNDGLP